MKRLRTKSAVRVAEFVSKFPLKSFLLQAPQVTADLWGVGIQLGSIMGIIGDSIYAGIRALGGARVTLRGPPPSDPLSKAVNYLISPMHHHAGGALWSYEDHWLLLAADVIAMRIVMDRMGPALFEQRGVEALDYPVPMQEPWHPATRAALGELGWSPSIELRSPYDQEGGAVTYRDVMTQNVAQYPGYLEQIRVDFPASSSATIYANILAEITEEVLTWGTGFVTIGKDVFDVEEYTLARMFEFGVLPPDDISVDLIDWMIQRSIEIARAGGRDLPDRGSMILAANEVWGGYSGQ